MKKLKLKWKVAPNSNFDTTRAWPVASYLNGMLAGFISCTDSYSPSRVRENKHNVLCVWVTDYSQFNPYWNNRPLKERFKTLEEAKAFLVAFLESNPNIMPWELSCAVTN